MPCMREGEVPSTFEADGSQARSDARAGFWWRRWRSSAFLDFSLRSLRQCRIVQGLLTKAHSARGVHRRGPGGSRVASGARVARLAFVRRRSEECHCWGTAAPGESTKRSKLREAGKGLSCRLWDRADREGLLHRFLGLHIFRPHLW